MKVVKWPIGKDYDESRLLKSEKIDASPKDKHLKSVFSELDET